MPTKKPVEIKKKAVHGKPELSATQTQTDFAVPIRFSEFATKWREQVNENLSSDLKDFVETALPEEKAFLQEALTNWRSGSSGKPVRGFQEHELPFLTALSETLNGELLVAVDSSEMVREVEQFITAKLASGWKVPKLDYGAWRNDTKEAVMERLRRLLMHHVDYLSYNCRQEDMNFLIDLLDQWETIVKNVPLDTLGPQRMAAAAEIHLEVLRRREEVSRAYEASKAAEQGK